MDEQLTLIRNECLFNSYVMYSGIRRIKKENDSSNKKSYYINTGVVITTLLSVFFATYTDKVTYKINLLLMTFTADNSQLSMLSALFAFGLSIAIFLFRDNKDTKVHYNIANSYWLLYKRAQDMIDLQKNNICSPLLPDLNIYLCHEMEKIKQQMELLVRFSPVFKTDDIEEAKNSLTDSSTFLYFNENDFKEIKSFFSRS